MKKTLASMIIPILMAVLHSMTAWSADALSDAAIVERQSVSFTELQEAAAHIGNYDLKSIRVDSKAHQILITVIDGKFNNTGESDRELEASKIALAIAGAISGKAEFSHVVVIHVDYVKQQDHSEKIVQGFDYYKSNTGTFSLHGT